MVKLDLGCGKGKKEGFIGVDQYAMPGVDATCNLGVGPWQLKWNPPAELVRWPEEPNEATAIGEYREGKYFHLFDNSIDEVYCSHFIEHLTNFNDKWERVRFFNELHRVLKPGAKATLIFPHWNSNRYYGDPTHKEPFGEMGFYYLAKEYRKSQAPAVDDEWNPDGYSCDFAAVWGYGMHPSLVTRNQEYQQFALQWYKEAAQDMHATLTKK